MTRVISPPSSVNGVLVVQACVYVMRSVHAPTSLFLSFFFFPFLFFFFPFFFSSLFFFFIFFSKPGDFISSPLRSHVRGYREDVDVDFDAGSSFICKVG